jgi:cellulose synthase/poly-beta-1,6-N-acetylglucosamine synthase-like glycosyltransferase
MHWQTFHWIAGSILGLAWFSRILDAAFGFPSIADIALPEWDRRPSTPDGEPRVSIIVPARNEAESIRATLLQLLALDYSNYEVIAVNDRSTDDTGQIMDEVAGSCGADTLVRVFAAAKMSARTGGSRCPSRYPPRTDIP